VCNWPAHLLRRRDRGRHAAGLDGIGTLEELKKLDDDLRSS